MAITNKIKILMISSSSSLGGGVKQMYTLGKNLSSDFQIFYAIPKNNNFDNDLNYENHIEISERKIKLKDILKLNNYIKKNSIDLIHAHGKGAGVLARILKLISKKTLIYTFHGIHLKCHKFHKRIIYILYEFLLGWIDSKKILVSKSEKKYAQISKIYLGKKAVVINNGVSNMLQKDSLKVNNYKNQIFQLTSTNVITICRFVGQKNIKEILKIASFLKGINFHIIGDGPLWKEINNLMLEKKLKNVFLLGKKKNVFKYLYSSDIYLSTSLYEGLPISILEAMSVGLPVIASNVMGNCDTIENGKSGYFYDLNNLNMAINYLLELDTNKELRKKFGKEAFIRQRKFFSKDLMITKHIELYKNQEI